MRSQLRKREDEGKERFKRYGKTEKAIAAISVLIDREAKGFEYGQHYRVNNLNELKDVL